MKTNDPLDDLLLEWRVQATPPASLRREVWGKIAAGSQSQGSLLERFFAVFFKPAVLAGAFAMALSLGAFTSWNSIREAQANSHPREQYLRSIDPFDTAHHLASR